MTKTNQHNHVRSLFALIAIFLLSSCSSSTSLNTDQSLEDDQIIPVNHELDENPSALSSEEQLLSLVGYGAIGALDDEDLSIADMLWYAVQDEYLALNEYIKIMEIFGEQKPYTNISNSERTHLSFLEEVYDSYNLEFPEDSSQQHVVVPSSLLEAAKTGVQAEIDNIEMYDKFLSYDLPENIQAVFLALKAGSESHLLAFEKQVDRLD